jgi:acetoin utilization protein AcuB
MAQTLVHALINDCMSPFLITVAPHDSLARAYELMMTNHVRRLPVVEHQKLVGIITLTDLLNVKQSDPGHRLSLEDIAREFNRLTIGVVMSKKPIVVYTHDTLGHAAELMLEHKIGGLPVLDADGHLAGILTESNIFAVLAKQWRQDNLIFSGAYSPESSQGQ